MRLIPKFWLNFLRTRFAGSAVAARNRAASPGKTRASVRRSFCPRLDTLEERVTPNAHTWSGGAGAGSPQWSNAANWSAGGAVTQFEDSVDITFPALGGSPISTNDVPNIDLHSFTFAAGTATSYTLNLNAAGQQTEDGGQGISLDNNNSSTQTINGSQALNITTFMGFGSVTSFAGAGAFVTINVQLTGSGRVYSGATPFLLTNSSNDYAGRIDVDTHPLYVTNDHTLGSVAGTTFVYNNATLYLQNAGGVNYATAEPLSLNNGTLQNTSGNSTFAGPITVATGTVFNAAGNLTLSGTISDGTLLTLDGNASTTLTASGVISGSGGLTKTNVANTVQLTGNSGVGYTGTTTVQGGVLEVDGNIGSSSVAVTGGTLTGTGTIGSLAATGGTINPGGIGVVGTLNSSGTTNSTFSGATFNVDVNGAVADQFTQATNAVNITGATLNVNTIAAPTALSYTILSGGSLVGQFVNAANGASVNFGGTTYIVNYTSTSVILTTSKTTNWIGSPGSNEWSSAADWSNGVPVSGDTVVFDTTTSNFNAVNGLIPNNDIAGLSNMTVQINDATIGGFTLTGFGIGLKAAGITDTNAGFTATWSMGLSLTAAATTFTVNAGNPLIVSSLLSGTGTLTKAGAGTLTLNNLANTYTGGTNILGGALSAATLANGGANSSIGASSNAAANLVFDGGTLLFTGATTTTDRLFTLNAGGGTIDSSGSGALSFSNAGALATAGAGATLTLSGTVAGNNTLTPTLTDGVSASNLVKIGTNTWVLAGANTYSGTTTISAGTIQDGIANALPTGTPLTVNGTLNLAGFNQQVTSVGGTGIVTNSAAAATFTVNNATADTFNGTLTGANLALTKTGVGTLTLSGTGANTDGGLTTVSTGNLTLNKTGVAALGGNLTIGVGAQVLDNGNQINNTASLVTNNGTVSLGTFTDTIGALAGAATGVVQLTSAPSSLTVGNATSATYNGTLSGSGALTKVGAGTLIVTGNSGAGFTGTTTVNAGTLEIDGSQSGSPVTLTAGTLQGIGTVKDIVATGGNVAPGGVGTIGTLSTATGAFATTLNGATFQVDVNNPAASDQLVISAGATLDLTGSTLSVNVLASAFGNVDTILTNPSAGISGTFTGMANGAIISAGGRSFRIAYTTTAVTLTDVQPTTTTVVASVNPSPPLQSVTFTATVQGSGGTPPTGSVSFTFDGLPLGGSVALVNGMATSTATVSSAMTGGYHTIVASYTPAGPSLPSTSGPVTQTVNAGPVSGVVFLDYNADGIRNGSDVGLAGRVVFLDANGNGRLDAGERSTVTDASGAYRFEEVATGTQWLNVSLFPSEDLVGGPSGTAVEVFPGQLATADLGLRKINPAFPVATSTDLFGANNPDTQTALAHGLYVSILGREGSAAEIGYWAARLRGGMSIGAVAKAFLQSDEYLGNQVDGSYRVFLNRTADAVGRAGWVEKLRQGMTSEEMTAEFIASAEYQSQDSDAASFVQSLYRNELGRVGGEGEVQGYVAMLNAGATRDAVARDFLNSTEASLRAIDSLYAQFLSRPGDNAGRMGWLAFISGGGRLTDLAVQFVSLAEFSTQAAASVG